MRKGFTLIELMIVIAIIAIIAAIAIPNLLESRITANEAAAATSLKSGLFPGQTQYQNGGYVDSDADGRGVFAAYPRYLAGAIGSAADITDGPTKSLSLVDPKFNNSNGTAADGFSSSSRAGAYDYAFVIDGTDEDLAESFYGAFAAPAKTDGSEARRAFGIGASGTVFATKQTVGLDSLGMGDVSNSGGAGTVTIFSTDSRVALPTQGSDGVPYQK